VKLARLVRVEAQVELILPTEFEARLRQGVVTDLRARMALGQIGGMCGQLVGDDSGLDIVLVGQARCSLGVT
jgi:hypothetical protein